MKEAKEATLLTASKKQYVDNAMAQSTSVDSQVGFVYASLAQLVTPPIMRMFMFKCEA